MLKALILIPVLALGACNMAADAQKGGGAQASGKGAQRSYSAGGFSSVSVEGPFDVVVTVGGAHSVRAEGDPEMLDKLRVEVDGRTLEVGTVKERWSMGWKGDRPKVTVYVTMPAIEAASIAGSGDLRVDKVEGRHFAASVAGSGDLNVASLRVNESAFSIAGSGNITANGAVQRAAVSIAGSGDVNIEGVEAATAKVSIVGSGDVRAKAMQSADVSIMGSGDVTMSGTAKCSVSKMGSGSVRCTG